MGGGTEVVPLIRRGNGGSTTYYGDEGILLGGMSGFYIKKAEIINRDKLIAIEYHLL